MEIVQIQHPEKKPPLSSPNIKIPLLEFAEEKKNSSVVAADVAAEERRVDSVQEEKLEECTTTKREPNGIRAQPVRLPPLKIKIRLPELADEKKNVRAGAGDGAEEERTAKRVQEECTTPKGEASRIPDPIVCPPPPERRCTLPSKRRTEIPPEKYFPVPSDLNSVFIPLKKTRTT